MKNIFIILLGLPLFQLGSTFAQVNLDNGLVAKYMFSGNANDESGNGINGIVHMANLTENRFGKANSAYYFNSAADYIYISSSLLDSLNSSFTICGWIYRYADVQIVLVSKRDNDYCHFQLAWCGGENYSFVRLTLGGKSFTDYFSDYSHEGFNNWYFIAATFNGNFVRLYFDGNLEAEIPLSEPINSYTCPATIGISTVGNFSKYKLDDICVYNRAINYEEIKALYQVGKNFTIEPHNLVFEPDSSIQNLSILSDNQWEIRTDADWLSVDQSSGFGNASIQVTAATNAGFDARTSEINIVGNCLTTIPVYQKSTPKIEIYNKDIGFSASGKNEELVHLKSNVPLNINCDADWVSFKETSDWFLDQFILINTQPNTTNISRQATISISANEVDTQFVSVTQEGVLNWKSYSISDGLIDNNISCVAIDSKNNKWFGTERGISKFDGIKWTNYQMVDGLVSDNITCVAIDKEDRVWVGTDKGISFFDGSIWISNEFSEKSINSIVISKNDEVLFATENEIFRNKGNWEKLAYNSAGGWVWKITCDTDNRLWILDEQGLFLYNLSDNTFTTIINGNSVMSNHIRFIYSGSESTLWLGNEQGEHMVGTDYYQGFVAITMLKGEEIFNYPLYFYGQSQGITSITEDLNQIMWFGAYGWVWKYDGVFWTRYTNSDGLKNGWKINIAVDAYNNKWFGTDSGVSVLVENEAGLYATINSIENANKLNIFPNPTTTQIQFTTPISSSHPSQLQLFDYLGRQILTQTLQAMQKGETITIDLSKQPAGIYLVRLKVGSEEFSGKVLLVK